MYIFRCVRTSESKFLRRHVCFVASRIDSIILVETIVSAILIIIITVELLSADSDGRFKQTMFGSRPTSNEQRFYFWNVASSANREMLTSNFRDTL
jgi:hypothetical protein